MEQQTIHMLMKKSQIAYLGNTLNEALKDIRASDFYLKLGAPQETVEELWNKFDHLYMGYIDDELREVALSDVESLILRNASLVCIKELDHREFQTRLGESPRSAQKLLRQLELTEEDAKDTSALKH
jgi:hypothetical protein